MIALRGLADLVRRTNCQIQERIQRNDAATNRGQNSVERSSTWAKACIREEMGNVGKTV